MDRVSAWLKNADITFALILFLGLLAFTARPATDPDLWWHLRTGQWMVENHQIPHSDPFSFTRTRSPWVSHEWLSELLLFEIWRFNGWAGLIIFSAIVTTSGFLLLFWRCKAPAHCAAAATVLGAFAAAPAWGVRPQMFTFLFASLWLWLLDRGETRPWLLLSIPPLFLLWINLHAGFALGPALLIAYGIGMVWEGMAGESPWQAVRPQVWRLALALAACLVLVPLNPSGAELYRYPLDVLRSGMMRSFISEWHSPDFHRGLYLPLLLVNLALLIVFASRSKRPRPRTLVPLIGTLLAAFDAVRHIPIFILFAIPVIASSFPHSSREWHTLKTDSHGRLKPAAVGVILAMMAVFAGTQWLRLARDQPQNEATSFPTRAVDQLRSAPPPERVFAHYDWGGYVIWRLFPKNRVFVDGRADLYGDDLLRQFQAVMQLRPGWQQTLSTWDVQSVLIPTSSALAQGLLLDPEWHRDYRDSQAVLFARKPSIRQTPEFAAVNQPLSGIFGAKKVKKSVPELSRICETIKN